jgi:hypothetical protein
MTIELSVSTGTFAIASPIGVDPFIAESDSEPLLIYGVCLYESGRDGRVEASKLEEERGMGTAEELGLYA